MSETAPTAPLGDILIVDDTPDNLRLLSQILTSQNYLARAVRSGTQALVAIQSQRPDIILLDVMMPDMDGYAVAAHLKSSPDTAAIPIIFISALNDPQTKVHAFKAGGADYITKPFQHEEVLARIETHLQLQRRNQEREALIAELYTINQQLADEVGERKAAQEAREASWQLLRTTLERTQALYRITQACVTWREVDDVLQAVVDNAARALPADRVVLMTFDTPTQTITRQKTGGPGAAQITAMTFAQAMDGLSGWAIQKVQPILSPKGRPDPREGAQAQRLREISASGSIIVAPLYYQERMLGTLTAINRLEDPDFTQSDLSMLNAIVGQVAIALVNIENENKLREYTRDLETQNAELEAFAHTVAHDLKSPLTVLMGFAELLRSRAQQNLTATQQQQVQVIAKTGVKMNDIIDELLLLASVRSMDDIPLNIIHTGQLIEEVCQRLHYTLDEYQASLILPPDWPAAVGYAPWLEEVWANYISNALKYGGQPSRVELGYTMLDSESPISDLSAKIQHQHAKIAFWVRDNGPGLTVEQQSLLFTPFERLHNARVTGHGLGLSIVHRIVEKLGGEVGVVSAPGAGSTFYFTLPVSPSLA